jgi:thioesterase domain-containing protein
LRQRTRAGENASGEALPMPIDAEPTDRVARISKADTLMTFLSDHITKEEFDFLNEYRNNDDVESIIAFCMSGRFPSIPDDRPLFERHLEVRHGILSALDKYEFAPISSRVTLFRAQEQMNGDRITDDKLTEKWMHLLDGNVRVVSVPGNHMNIVKHPNLADLGAAISGGKAHRTAPIGFGQKTKRVRV